MKLGEEDEYDDNVDSSSSGKDTIGGVSKMMVFSRFVWFSISFACAESALVVMVSLASRLFGTTGSLSVAALYVSYAIGTLFASEAVRVQHCLTLPLILGQVGLLPMNLASLYVIHVGAEKNGGSCWKDCHFSMNTIPLFASCLLIGSAIVSGIAAGIAWATAGAFITKTATVLSSSTTSSSSSSKRNAFLDGLWNDTFHVLAGNLTSCFNVILIGIILSGHIFSYYSLLPMDDGPHVYNTFVILCYTGILSTLLMIFLVKDPTTASDTPSNDDAFQQPQMNDNDNREMISSSSSSFVDRIGMTVREPQLRGLILIHLTSGLCEGVVLCWVGATLVPQSSMIGYLAAMKNIAAAMASPIFSIMGNNATSGRIPVILIGQFFYLASILWIFLLLLTQQQQQQQTYQEWMLIWIYITAGIGFSMWQGTAGGAFLSEIGTQLSTTTKKKKKNVEEANVIITAAFSGCKAISGTATAFIFIYFSSQQQQQQGNHATVILLLCMVTCCWGILQVHYQTDIWNPTISFLSTTNHSHHDNNNNNNNNNNNKSISNCEQAEQGESQPLISSSNAMMTTTYSNSNNNNKL